MSSPFRVYSFMNRIFKTKTQTIINLTKVSRVELSNNTLKFFLSHEKENIGGSFLFFSGGNTSIERIRFNTDQEAENEFNDVLKQLVDYYKK